MTCPFSEPRDAKVQPYWIRPFDAAEFAKHLRLRNAMERLHREQRQAMEAG